MTELGAFLLPAVPLLVLLGFLVFGRYPGSEAIARLAGRSGSRTCTRHAAAVIRPRPPRSFAPAGGLLLALSLSGRAPPA